MPHPLPRFAARVPALIAGLFVFASLAGCGTYYGQYDFSPRSAEMRVDLAETAADSDARVVLSVVGLRRALPDATKQPGVDLKVRIENLGASRVRFDPADVVVLDSTLEPLDGPIDPPPAVELPQTGAETILLTFALPPDARADDNEMAGLNVRLSMQVDGETATRSISFERRRDESFYDRYYYPRYPYAYPHRRYYRACY